MAGGRPTAFTPELGAEICLRIMTYPIPTNSLKHICEADEMPCRRTVYYWMMDAAATDASEEKKEFLHRYEVSQRVRLENMFEEVLDVAYDDSDDTLIGKDGERGNSTAVSRARLKTDNLRWCLSKLDPEKYSDRTKQELSGDLSLNAADELIRALTNKKDEESK